MKNIPDVKLGIIAVSRDCFPIDLSIKRREAIVKACGGGTKSKAWMQILADVLGVELSVIQNEGPAYGGALLAAGAAHEPTVETTVGPDPQKTAQYEKKYQKFRQLYPLLKSFYKEN